MTDGYDCYQNALAERIIIPINNNFFWYGFHFFILKL